MIDEAGISGSAHELVSVVAAVVFPSGQAQIDVYDAVDAVHDMAPARYRDGFVFHATDLLKAEKGKYSEGWAIEDRQMMMHQMLQIPFDMGCKVIYASIRNSPNDVHDEDAQFTLAEARHRAAFALCIGAINDFLTQNGVTGVAVVEQAKDMNLNRVLNGIALGIKDTPMIKEMVGFPDGRDYIQSIGGSTGTWTNALTQAIHVGMVDWPDL
jgi:hypothetical protein